MKAIKIKKQVKDNNRYFFRNNAVGSIASFEIPKTFKRTLENGETVLELSYDKKVDLHPLDGWGDIVEPTLLENQYKGRLIENTSDPLTYTYEVLTLTDEEVRERALAQADGLRALRLEQEQIKLVDEKFNALEDAAAIENKDVYPLWKAGVYNKLDDKVRWFLSADDATIALWKNVQALTAQEQFPPYLIPAHWTRIPEAGQVLAWVQPTGAQDAYNTGDRVHYPTLSDPIYESTVDANVFAPLVVAGQWKLVN